jgi:hypothetical protein
MVVAGLCWFAMALGFGLLLFQYLAEGAGLQVFGFLFGLSCMTILIGWVHATGFAAAGWLGHVVMSL